jgi:FkbM family methyltransferase
VTRALRRRLSTNYYEHPEMELPLPYDLVQLDVERHLHKYLHVPPEKISQIIIVGACDASEVRRMRQVYSQAQFLCFEPNPQSFQKVVDTYARCPWVTVRKLAVSDAPGHECFYELDMPGNGSLLKPDVDLWSSTVRWKNKNMTSFEVELSTLDREASSLETIDLLWMDVQGAEGKVLAGGPETLKRTKAVFLEVALVRLPTKEPSCFPRSKPGWRLKDSSVSPWESARGMGMEMLSS